MVPLPISSLGGSARPNGGPRTVAPTIAEAERLGVSVRPRFEPSVQAAISCHCDVLLTSVPRSLPTAILLFLGLSSCHLPFPLSPVRTSSPSVHLHSSDWQSGQQRSKPVGSLPSPCHPTSTVADPPETIPTPCGGQEALSSTPNISASRYQSQQSLPNVQHIHLPQTKFAVLISTFFVP